MTRLEYFSNFIGGYETVRLDGKVVGRIFRRDGGFQYVPNGNRKIGGEVYPTLEACKKSLESD